MIKLRAGIIDQTGGNAINITLDFGSTNLTSYNGSPALNDRIVFDMYIVAAGSSAGNFRIRSAGTVTDGTNIVARGHAPIGDLAYSDEYTIDVSVTVNGGGSTLDLVFFSIETT